MYCVLLILFFQTLLRNSVDGKLLTNLPNKSLHHVKTKTEKMKLGYQRRKRCEQLNLSLQTVFAELKAKHIEWAGYFKYKSK